MLYILNTSNGVSPYNITTLEYICPTLPKTPLINSGITHEGVEDDRNNKGKEMEREEREYKGLTLILLKRCKGLAHHQLLVFPTVSFFCHLRNMNKIISIYPSFSLRRMRAVYFLT
jgi:hypothetical protein